MYNVFRIPKLNNIFAIYANIKFAASINRVNCTKHSSQTALRASLAVIIQ